MTAQKVRRTSRVAAQYISEADLLESLWLDLASSFERTLPIPYVQAAILNWLNPYIYGVATALRDKLHINSHCLMEDFDNKLLAPKA